MNVWIRRAEHATPHYPKKLALTSPTSEGRSVGIVRSRTKATELFSPYFRHSYIGGKFGHIYIGLPSLKVAYAERDVIGFIQQMAFKYNQPFRFETLLNILSRVYQRLITR
jgi:hypothetical protein